MFDVTLRVVLSGLACYRLAQLLPMDYGPFGVFEKIRSYTKDKAANVTGLNNLIWRDFSEFVHCPFCQGIWIAVLLALLNFYPSLWGDLILLVFGIAGIQAAIESRL